MTIPVEDVGNIQSLLTVVGGKVVYASAPYEQVGAKAPNSVLEHDFARLPA
jgi:hypothetical protein